MPAFPDLSETLHRDRMDALSRHEEWARQSAEKFPGRRHARWRRKYCSNGQHLMKLAREIEPIMRCTHCIATFKTTGPTPELLGADESRTW